MREQQLKSELQKRPPTTHHQLPEVVVGLSRDFPDHEEDQLEKKVPPPFGLRNPPSIDREKVVIK